MQIIIHIKNSEELSFPLSYNYQLSSAIYKLLSDDEELSTFFHDEGFFSGTGRHKLFAFSPLLGHHRIKNKKIIFDSSISFEVRSISDDFIKTLRDSAFKSGHIKLFSYDLEIGMIEVYDRHLYATEAVVRTVSPVAAAENKDNKTVYYSPDDEEFLYTVNRSLYNRFNAAFGDEPPSILNIRLLSEPKKVVTRIKGLWVTAYHAQFALSAAPEVMDFIYNTGIGSKTSQGFGMIEAGELEN